MNETTSKLTGPVLVLLLLCNIFAFSSAEMTEEQLELIQMLHNSCQEETGATEDMIKNARTGNFADDEGFKCYFKCLYSQMAIMDDDGMIDVELEISLMPEEMQATLAPVMRSCGTQKGANPCDTAWLTNKCLQAGAPSAYFLP